MVNNKKNRELFKLPVLFITFVLLSTPFSAVMAQSLLVPSLLSGKTELPDVHETPADSGTQQIVVGFDAAPVYYEWSDSTLFHRDYQAEGFLRFRSLNDPWDLGLEYRYRTFGFSVHPVDYQDLKSQLTSAATRVFVRRKSLFDLTPTAMLSYDQASRRWNYLLSLEWSRYSWIRPQISQKRSTIDHHTIFHLFQTDLRFQDLYRLQTTSLTVTSSESASRGYAVTYSPGKILQPTGIRSQDESQQTDLRAIHSGGLLWFTLFGEVTIKPYYNSNRYHGKSFWYSFGTRFADFNKILLTDKLTSIELCWRNLGYTFSREKIRYELYGQVRGFPFTSAAIDLLGSEFVISSQGAADITSHQLSLRLGRETQSFLRLTTAYQQVDLLKFDYRTYALILGFPRRETLRISRSKLQRATLFKLSLHGSIPLTSHLSCVPALLQYIPIHVEYTSTSQPGGGPAPSGKRHTFGGLRISVQFYYTI